MTNFSSTIHAIENTIRLLFLLSGLLLWSCEANAEHYTVPLLVSATTSDAPQGVLRVLNGTAESGTVEIYAIDDAGSRSGPATFTLNAAAAAEFTATELQSGNATKGLTGGIGADMGDARLQIETDLQIVPLVFVRAPDGTLSAMHDTVRAASVSTLGQYRYDVPSFNPSTEMTQRSRLRLINPGDATAAVTIAGRHDSGAAAIGGDVTLMLAAGGAQTLTAQQLEAGDSSITGQLGAGTGKWRLTVSSGQPLHVVNIVAASAGYWNNLSTTAVLGAAPADQAGFDTRFVGERVVSESSRGSSIRAFADDDRLTETTETDGVTETNMGRYSYEAIGPDAGLLTLDYDDGDVCRPNLYFSTRTSGWFASHCTGSAFPAAGTWLAGSWSVEDPDDLSPSFAAAAGPGNQSYTVGTAIVTLTLPEAIGGNGTLNYSLSPTVPDLSFNATSRELTGTPSTEGTHAMTYTATDEDGDTDTLSFMIAVSAETPTEGSLGVCQVGVQLRSGQRCTYPGTTDVFSVNVRGRGSFLTFLAGIRIRINNETINDRVYDFEASHQGDGVWRIDRVAGSTEPPSGTGGGMDTDTSPSFADEGAPGNQTYMVGTAIDTLTLPTASGGDGMLTYGLSPDVPGLSFNAMIRQLSGTPTTAGIYAMTYTVTDFDGDTDTLNFTVTVTEEVVSTTSDRAALMALYDATDGENWRNSTNWGSSAPLGQWYGVSLDIDGRVIQLDLSRNRLSGPVPVEELSRLSNLRWLLLHYNQLSGPIPAELGTLSNLEWLALNFNQLSGPIPAELSRLSELKKLFLNGNQLSGPIPVELGALSKLETLQLADNLLSGPIPVELGALSELKELFLKNNELSGSIPPVLGALSNLQALYLLGGNQLTGCIPGGLADVPISDLTTPFCENFGTGGTLINLPTGVWTPDTMSGGSFVVSGGDATVELDNGGFIEEASHRYTCQSAGGCTIRNRTVESGTIVQTSSGTDPAGPPMGDRAALMALYNATDGENWHISANWGSSAPLYDWYQVFTHRDGRVRYLWPTRNNLSGPIPAELGLLSKLESLTLVRNQLSGSIPGELGRLSNLLGLHLGYNQLSGPIPAELGRLSNLLNLSLWRNRLSGPIPVELGALSNVHSLDLSFNQLSGPIPAEFGRLSNLRYLHLSYNQLNGPIPVEFGAISNLRNLGLVANQLSGPIPVELGGLSELARLHLNSNQLNGPIPVEFGALFNLTHLELPNNQLSGPVPVELGRLSTLVNLHLHNNRLSGPIPSELGALFNLQELNLSENQLSGPISAELGALSSLRELNLSGNQFNGPIPAELGRLSNLVSLFLGDGNQFSGCIPAGLEDVRLNDLTTLGLPLCGTSESLDLVVQTPSVTDANPGTGDSFTLSATVHNRGSGAFAATTLRYYRSYNETFSSSDTPIGTDSVSGLTAAGTSAESIELNAPSSAGTYYYGACVDPASGESDTGNNCSTGVRVDVADDSGVGTGTCRRSLVVNPGESCTYKGYTFTVSDAGRGSIAHFNSPFSIDVRWHRVYGAQWLFYAARHIGSNSWEIIIAD